MLIINCPDCNEFIRLPDDAGGNTIQCLRCKSIILIREKRIGAPDFYGNAEAKALIAASPWQSRWPDL